MDDAIEIGDRFGIVGDHHNRLSELFVQLAQHFQHYIGIFRVEVAGRLVGEENLWLVDDGAGNGDSLLFAAGHFGWLVIQAAFEAQQFCHDVKTMRVEAVAVNILCDGDVAFRGHSGQQIEALKDETDFAAAELGAFAVGHCSEIVAVHQNCSTGRGGEAADRVEKR